LLNFKEKIVFFLDFLFRVRGVLRLPHIYDASFVVQLSCVSLDTSCAVERLINYANLKML